MVWALDKQNKPAGFAGSAVVGTSGSSALGILRTSSSNSSCSSSSSSAISSSWTKRDRWRFEQRKYFPRRDKSERRFSEAQLQCRPTPIIIISKLEQTSDKRNIKRYINYLLAYLRFKLALTTGRPNASREHGSAISKRLVLVSRLQDPTCKWVCSWTRQGTKTGGTKLSENTGTRYSDFTM